MSDTTGAVYDLGYEPYEGERRGRVGARRTVMADGIRRVLGFRRKTRRKVMPFILVAIAVIPTIAFVGVSFLIPVPAGGSELPTLNANMFVIGGTIAMLFTALAAPELLIPDRTQGVLSMLSSRPLTATDYVVSRLTSIVAVVGGFLLVPQVVLYLGQAGTDPGGLFEGIAAHAHNLPKIAFATATYTLAFVPIGFVIAGFSKRKAIASSIYIATMIGLSIFANAMVRESNIAGSKWLALASPIDTADAVSKWIFDRPNSDSLMAIADIHPSVALIALLAIGLTSMGFVLRRYRRLM